MSCETYFVVPDRGQWKFELYGLPSQAFATEQDAVNAAIALADKAVRAGQPAKVYLRPNGRAGRIVWSHDPTVASRH